MQNEPNITYVALDRIGIAPENPRYDEPSPKGIDDLASNIAAIGLLLPLIGYLTPEGDEKVQITAGGRRVRALRLVAESQPVNAVPVKIMERDAAISAGIAEQLAHVALSEIEELRLFTSGKFDKLSDKELAPLLGRSLKYVGQLRKVAALPPEVVNEVFEKNLTFDQARGLCLAENDPELLASFFERALESPEYRYDQMRYEMARQYGDWKNAPLAKIVSQADYIEAGGGIERDLFGESEFILDPHILRNLALPIIQKNLEAEHPNAAFIEQISRDSNGHDLDIHPGFDKLNDDEREEWEDIRYESWRHGEDEDWMARYDELKKKAAPYYTKPLEKALGVAWWFDPYNRKDGYCVRTHVLPADLEPLYKKGWLDRPVDPEPSPVEEADEPTAAETLSSKLKAKIVLVKLHVTRQIMAVNADTVLSMYARHLALGTPSYAAAFSVLPESADDTSILTGLAFNPKFESLIAASALTAEDLVGAAPEKVRDYLAGHMLARRTRHDLPSLGTDEIRQYWSPDKEFLAGYSKTDLAAMIADLADKKDTVHILKMSKIDLVEWLADLAASHKDWLPSGF